MRLTPLSVEVPMKGARLALVLILFCGSPASALPEEKAKELIEAARSLLGVPYEFGGRMRRRGEGIDCQGVVFYALERIDGCGWKSFSTMPTQSVKDGEIGEPVSNLAPILSEALDISVLEPGDHVRLLDFVQNPKEPNIGTLHGRPVWVWHVGLYVGSGRWLHADPIAGEVVEVDFAQYLAENAATYPGVFISRMKQGPTPAECRQNPPMKRRFQKR